MKNFSTWILVMFMIMFWGFRVIVAVTTELGIDFGGIVALNSQMEVILLFAVLVCIVLVIKRKMIGGLIYLLLYGMYFGVDLYNNVKMMISVEDGTLGMSFILNTFISFLGIVIAIAVLFDLLVDKNRKLNPKDKKTDWFYKNKDYDRKLDDRADKNNYRTM